jgi:hypothetical protein
LVSAYRWFRTGGPLPYLMAGFASTTSFQAQAVHFYFSPIPDYCCVASPGD